MKICPFCYHKVEQHGPKVYLCTGCGTYQGEGNLEEIKIIRFFCPKCGKEMWTGLSEGELWDTKPRMSLFELKQQLVCSDCLLIELREATEAEK